MRKNLVSFLIRMAIVTVLMTGGTLHRTLGHDLPNYFPDHQLGADCLGVKLPEAADSPAPDVVLPAMQVAKPTTKHAEVPKFKLVQLVNPSSALTLGFAYSDATWNMISKGTVARQVAKQLDRLSALIQFGQRTSITPHVELTAVRPDDAPAPSPAHRAPAFSALVTTLPDPVDRALVKQNFVEDYLPYDLCIRDWRFGQFSYRGLSRIAHVKQPAAEVTNAAELNVDPALLSTAATLEHGHQLGQALCQLSDLQCSLYSELSSFDSAYELGAYSARQYQSLSDAAARQVLNFAQGLPVQPRTPYYSSPVFVVYEMDGKSFVVPAEQAQQWQAFRAARQPESVVSTRSDELEPRTCPLRKSVLNMASQQLTYFGNKLLNVAASIESYSDVQIAGSDKREVR